MSVKAYCDCSGKTESNSPFLTLASYFCTDRSWTQLEREWTTSLQSHNAPYFHAREAMNCQEGFAGWDFKRVYRLVGGLFNVLGGMDRTDFFGTSCTVDLQQYREAKRTIPKLRSPEQICLDFCIGTIFRHPQRERGIELVFDRDESFQLVMHRLWKARNPKTIWWADWVTDIGTADMRTSPALQSSDLLAWFSNRYRTKGHNDVWGGLYAGTFLLTPHFHAFVDSRTITSIYDSNGAMKPNAQVESPSIKFPTE